MPARVPSASLQRSGSGRQGRAGSNAVHPIQPPVSAPEWATALNPTGSFNADGAASAVTLSTSYNNPCFDKGAHSHNNEGLLGKGTHSHSHSSGEGVSAAGSLGETANAHKADQEAEPGPLPCEAPLAAAPADGGEALLSPYVPAALTQSPAAAAPPVQPISLAPAQSAAALPAGKSAAAAAAATPPVPPEPAVQSATAAAAPPVQPIPAAQSAPTAAASPSPMPPVPAAQPAQAMPAAQSAPAAAAATPPVPPIPAAQSALAPERPAVAVRRLLHAVAAGGLQPEARASVWPQLLGCHSQDSTQWQLPGSCQGRQEAERLFRGLLYHLQNDEQVAGWYSQQGASEGWMLTHRRIVGDAQRLTVTPPFLQPGSASRTECVERLIRVLSLYALSNPELGYCQGMSDLAAPLLELWGQHAAEQPQQGLQHLGPELQQLQQSMAHSSPSNAQDLQDLLSARQQLQQASQQLQQLQQRPEADTQQVSDQAHACGKGQGAADRALGRAAKHAGEAGAAIQDTQPPQQPHAVAQQEAGAQQAQQAAAGRHSELEADFWVFWCFSRLMRLVRQRFMGRMEVLREDLRRLSTLVQHLDPPLNRHLSSIGAGTFEFAFQMLLLLFRRELPWGESNRLWDGLLALYRLECPDDGWITAGGVTNGRVGDGGAAAAGASGRVEAEGATGAAGGAQSEVEATAGAGGGRSLEAAHSSADVEAAVAVTAATLAPPEVQPAQQCTPLPSFASPSTLQSPMPASSVAMAATPSEAAAQAQECEALRSLVIATAAALLQLHRPSLLRCRGLEEVVQLMNRLPDPGPGAGLKLAAAAAAIVREEAARAIVAGRKQREDFGVGRVEGKSVGGGGPTLAGTRERGGKEATARGLCGLGC